MLLTTFISVDSTVVKTGGKVAEMIRDGRFEELGERSITWGIEFLGKLAIALLIFFVGKWIIGKIRKFADRIMSRRQMDIALKGFLKNLIEIFLFTPLITAYTVSISFSFSVNLSSIFLMYLSWSF
jgi:small conductance mechanosensitive channel